MRIEAGHGVDLAQRHIDPGGQPPQLVRGQVAEFVLDAPQFVEHSPSIPLALHHNVAPSPAIVTAKVHFGMPAARTDVRVRPFLPRT